MDALPWIGGVGWCLAAVAGGALAWSRGRLRRSREAALAASGPVVVVRRDGGVIAANEAFRRVFQPEPAPSRLDRETAESLDVSAVLVQDAAAAVAAGREWEGTVSLRRPLGDVVQLRVHAVPAGGGEWWVHGEDRTQVEQLDRRHRNLVSDVGLAISARTAELLERNAELQRAKAAFQDLYDNAPHIYLTLDDEGRIVGCNQAAALALGLARGSWIGRSLADLAAPESRQALEEAAATLAAGRPVVGLEVCLRAPTGRSLQAILEAAPAAPEPGAKGRRGTARVQAVDVTALKAQQELLRRALQSLAEKNALLEARSDEAHRLHRLKSEFVATVSHELRTPLHAVIGFAELLRGGIYGRLEPAQAQAVGGIVGRGGDLLRLINDLLDLSRMEAGRMALEEEGFDPAAVAEEVAATGRILVAGRAAVRVDVVPEGGPGPVRGDRGRYRQILLNLVSNAVRHVERGAVEVAFHTGADGRFSTVVSDTGSGIPAGELSSIFDPFYQVDGSSTRRAGGAGLGLAIARQLAERMGGDLTAASRVGEGSRFTLRLPVSGAPDPGEADPAPAAPSAGRPPTVLVISPDPAERSALAAALADEGFASERAGTGREALARARERLPTAVVLAALATDDLPAAELVASLRADPLTAHVPVVALLPPGEAPREGPGAPDASLRQAGPEEVAALVADRAGRPGRRLLWAAARGEDASRVADRLREDGMGVVHAETGKAAVHRLRKRKFALVVVDVDSLGRDGFAVLGALGTLPPGQRPPAVALADLERLNMLERRALERRVAALLSKDASGDGALLRVVRALVETGVEEEDDPR